jgi:hypothetical protein
MKKRPSKTLTFFLSLCPGVGHLYLGAMTRGLQFLILFFGLWALINLFSLGVFGFGFPIVWFYSLFDALQLADQEVIEDKPLITGMNSTRKWFGPSLIVLGALLLMEDILPNLWRKIFVSTILPWENFSTLVLALVLIIVGILLLRGKKVKDA